MRIATIRYTETGCDISSPWDQNFLDDLKTSIPFFARSWKPEHKLWSIRKNWVPVAVEVTRRHFRVVEIPAEEQKRQSTHTSSDVYAVLCLLPSAPRELVKAAYRVLALAHHPDREGGDIEKMQRLNAAYEKLTK
jgi:hypothetical protein